MTITKDSIIEKLTTLALTINKNKKLRKWFCDLAKKPAQDRTAAIIAMSERIATQGKDVSIAGLVMMLADPRVFQATLTALRGC